MPARAYRCYVWMYDISTGVMICPYAPKLLEWTQLVCTTSFYGFICVDLTHSVRVGVRHVERNNDVPLFGVDPIECRLTRYYVIRYVSAI